jgi:hypothetical protein
MGKVQQIKSCGIVSVIVVSTKRSEGATLEVVKHEVAVA